LYSAILQLGLFQQESLNVISLLLLEVVVAEAAPPLDFREAVAVVLVEYDKEQDSRSLQAQQ
jgi:hypothetical protein